MTDTLYALTQSSGVLSVRTIARRPATAAARPTGSSRRSRTSQYAEQREDGGYTVGRRLVELAARVFGVVPVLQIVDDIMTELVSQVGETCYLATYNEGDAFATFVHRVESDHLVRHVQALGTRLPLHAGAVGKAILSAADIDLDSLDLAAFTPQTPTTVAALKKDVESARELGYATSFEERVVGVDGVAAPSSRVTPSSAVSPSRYPPHALPKMDSRPSAASCANERTSCRWR